MDEKFFVAFVGRIKNGILYEFLKNKGWSQAEFARQLGASMIQVSNWMLLKSAPRKETILQKIEELTGRLREDIFPELLHTKEWQEFMADAPREYAVIREISARALRAGKNPLALPSPEEKYFEQEEEAESLRTLRDALGTLTPRELEIVKAHFGIDAEHEASKTLIDIGKSIGISQERVRQIERSAFRKLHRKLRRR